MWGKDNNFASLELNFDFFKDRNRKIDSKEVKPFLSSIIDIDTYFNSAKDKQSKIYELKVLYYVKDYMILGTNKGLLILKMNDDNRPCVVPCLSLIELNEKCLNFLHLANNSLYEQAFTVSTSKNQLVSC